MKKAFLLSMAIVVVAGAYAQQFTQEKTFKNPLHFNDAKVIDTLLAPVYYTTQLCADTTTYYNVGTGYLTGNAALSGQSILEVGQGFSQAGTVSEVFAVMNRISGTSAPISAKIYNTTSGTFVPTGSALGTSNTVQTSDISNTTFQLVNFTFTTPVVVTNNFVASIVLPTSTGDTVVIGGTRLGCIDATKDDRAVFSLAGNWMTYKSITSTQGGSIDLMILVKIDVAGGVSENQNSFSLYPNPANDLFVVSAKERINSIRVYDIFGHLVYEDKETATNSVAVNTESFSNGAYFVTIESAQGKSTQRLMIAK